MAKRFSLFIDESGDQGLERVMTREVPFGASSYLTMGAVLVPTQFEDKFRQFLDSVQNEMGVSQLHCTDMNHAQVSYFAKKLAELRILCFGVVSKKATLGSYKKQISGEDQAQDYYNKCCHYLFELVGKYAGENDLSARDIAIIFEKKRGHDYRRMERYLKAISDKPIDNRAAKLANLAPFVIEAKTKEEESLLALADATAYSLHKAFCSENNRLKLTEQRYLRELKSKFCKSKETDQIANHGIKFIKGPLAMGLFGEDRRFALKFYQKKE